MSLYAGDMNSRIMAGEKMEDVLKNPNAPKTNWAELSKNLLNNQGFPDLSNVKYTPEPVIAKPIKAKEDITKKLLGAYNKNLIIAVVLVAGYFAYKKFKK
jgi:hypothetical protein